MLNALRRNAGSWFIKFILSFIALTFIIWGVGNHGEENSGVVAVVGKEKIRMNEFLDAVGGLEEQYRQLYGPAFTPELSRTLGLRKQTINTLIRQRIMLKEAARMGLAATDYEVQRDIAENPNFQVNGKFNKDLYSRLLSQKRVTMSQFESAIHTQIILGKLHSVLTTGAFVPESEARVMHTLSARKIRALVVTGDPAKMKNLPAPSNEEIEAMYERVKESFRIPARVKLAVAVFTPELFSKEINPSEEEVKAFYDLNANMFLSEEQRLFSRIVIPYTKQNKEDLLNKISLAVMETPYGRAGFESAAKKLGATKTAETWATRKDVDPTLGNALFQAPVDVVVGPVDMGNAFVLAHVSRIKFSEPLPVSQVRDRVVELIRLEQGKDLAMIKAYEAHPKAVASKDLVKTAEIFGVKTVKTDWLNEAGTLETPAQAVREALLLFSGEIGSVITQGDRHYLFQVLAKEDSYIPPLDKIRPQILSLVMTDQQNAAAYAKVQKALSDAKTAADLNAMAKMLGLSAETTPLFAPLRDELPQSLAQTGDVMIRKDLALLSPRSPLSPKIYRTPGGLVMALGFLSEQPATEKDWETDRNFFLQALRNQEKENIVEGFLSDRMKHYKVEIKLEELK